MGYEPADGLSEAHAVGLYSRVSVFQDESEQQGLSQVLLTLRTENTRALPTGVFDYFEVPGFSGHILTPDPGYGVPKVGLFNTLGLGFRFNGESSSLHCYPLADERTGSPETLSEVASLLVSTVDDRLRPYASTIPVHR